MCTKKIKIIVYILLFCINVSCSDKQKRRESVEIIKENVLRIRAQNQFNIEYFEDKMNEFKHILEEMPYQAINFIKKKEKNLHKKVNKNSKIIAITASIIVLFIILLVIYTQISAYMFNETVSIISPAGTKKTNISKIINKKVDFFVFKTTFLSVFLSILAMMILFFLLRKKYFNF